MSCIVNESNECCICMEVLTNTNRTTTECGHTFHSSCIFRNLCERIECPMCRKELVEPEKDDDEYSIDEEDGDDDDDDDDSVDSDATMSNYQFLSEDLNGNPQADPVGRFMEYKRYSCTRETDPVISYEQIVNKMMQMGVTPADILSLYCGKIYYMHTETTEDANKYSPTKIHELDILYRKIARGEIAVNYRDQRSYASVLQTVTPNI